MLGLEDIKIVIMTISYVQKVSRDMENIHI